MVRYPLLLGAVLVGVHAADMKPSVATAPAHIDFVPTPLLSPEGDVLRQAAPALTLHSDLPMQESTAIEGGPFDANTVAEASATVVSKYPDLPVDYRSQIVAHERAGHPQWGSLIISYSDPAPVVVRDRDEPARWMTGVAYSYTPRSPGGAVYFMIVQGAALFERKQLVRTVRSNDTTVDWVEGRPAPHSDTAAGRQYEMVRFERARKLHDAVAGPAELRQIRRVAWVRYREAIAAVESSPARREHLFDLLVARDRAPLDAQFGVLQKGVDPFSGVMDKAVEAATREANAALRDYLGADQLDHLEQLRGAQTQMRLIKREVGLDLADAGCPLSDQQRIALGLVYQDALDPARNPRFGEQGRQRDPTTGLDELDQTILRRAASFLSAPQQEVLRTYFTDRALNAHRPRVPAGRDSSWLLHEPTYGPAFRRELRRMVMRDYTAAVADLHLAPKQGERVIELLCERNLAPREAVYQVEEHGGDVGAKNAARLAAVWQVDALLVQELGPEGMARIERFKRLERSRFGIETDEAADLELAGCPATPAQLDAMVEAFGETNSLDNPNYASLRTTPDDRKTGLRALDAAYLERLKSVLSDQQLAVVRTHRQDVAAVLRKIEAENGGLRR